MNEQNLAGEFCVVAGEFSDLRCLMNTLQEQQKQNIAKKAFGNLKVFHLLAQTSQKTSKHMDCMFLYLNENHILKKTSFF